jgi:hypothetical protein
MNPALWILGGRGVTALGRYHRWLLSAALALVVAVPIFWPARAAVEKSQLDTRIHAEARIESNVPSGARILVDGMQYRFSQSPPLNPDSAAVEEKVERAIDEGRNFGRGVSKRALSVYQKAMITGLGPKYALVSTVHGPKVQDYSYYVNESFEYIVTSSMVAGRFRPGSCGRSCFPESPNFYDTLDSDPRVNLVHEESAIPWKKSGPTIRVYRIAIRYTSR